MSDGTYNRPRRQFEPRVNDERGRDFGGPQFHAPDPGAHDRRDPESDPLSDLARLMGEPDPYAPNSFAPAPRRANEAAHDRHDLDFPGRDLRAVAPRAPSTHADTDDFERRYATDNSGYSGSRGRDEFPVAPLRAPMDGADYAHDGDYAVSLTAQQDPAYHRHDEYADEYPEGELGQDGEYDYDYDSDDAHADDGGSGVKRRNTVKVVVAVLGLAVFGSAAAFGYRTIFKASPPGPTPVIRADNSPTKVMPVGADSNPKPINERVGDRAGERLLRRDEDPVDVGAASRSGGGGVVGSAGPFQGTPASPPPATVPASTGPASLTDPKPVRTVTIKPDQAAPAPADRAVPPSPRPAAPLRQAAATPAPPPSAGGAPVSLLPDVAAPRVAAATPPPVAPRASESGGFVVQLSAQKSEADAQASFRTMQAKYPVLNGRQPLIRRKDQGERGIFYAAQVGPFGAKSEADQLCETLKSAGGSCFVQRN